MLFFSLFTICLFLKSHHLEPHKNTLSVSPPFSRLSHGWRPVLNHIIALKHNLRPVVGVSSTQLEFLSLVKLKFFSPQVHKLPKLTSSQLQKTSIPTRASGSLQRVSPTGSRGADGVGLPDGAGEARQGRHSRGGQGTADRSGHHGPSARSRRRGKRGGFHRGEGMKKKNHQLMDGFHWILSDFMVGKQ